ncbi:hypothetical protein D1013_16525 [Euzebyella marina]|uniref:Lipocalin-like domain-containing protein n=1 Tax=Euzebyella marina TaxID=1761453 RepID=A0A3G2L9F8_9FLAO|nr:hypothetical protein [Euzebyella marina]AYN68870.1 hypothetical protein D1013_16525 [Euzebyella marina]
MKSKTLKILLFGLCCIGFGSSTSVANDNSKTMFYGYADIQTIVNDLVGIWQYTVDNAPPEYSKGVIVIKNETDSYAVEVQIPAGTLQGSNVNVDGSQISFELNIEGTVFTVKLIADGDTISGESFSYDGSYGISGTRVKPQ